MKTAGAYLADSAQFAGSNGSKPESKEAYRYLNKARELLWDLGDWEGTMLTGQLQLTEKCFFLCHPGGLVRNAYRGCDDSPVALYEGQTVWSSLTELSGCCASQQRYPFHRTGLTSPLPAKYPSGTQIGFIAENCEDKDLEVTVRYDTGKGACTETLTLKDEWKPVWSKGLANKIVSIEKEPTKGTVKIVSGATPDGYEQCVHVLEPEEVFPCYPQYVVNGCPCESCMVVRVKKKPVQIIDPGQPIELNCEALDWAMKAMVAKESNNHVEYAQNVKFAKDRLNLEKETFTNRNNASMDVPMSAEMITSDPYGCY